MTSRGQIENSILQARQILERKKTFLKAKLWAGSAGDRIDAVVEALVRKFSTVRVKLEVGQQGVVDGSNLLLLTTFLLSLNLANGEQDEEE